MTSLFQVIAADQTESTLAVRKAAVLANHRVGERLGAFIRGAATTEERAQRLSLVREDLDAIVAGAVQEIGSGDPAKIAEQIATRLAACECGASETCECDNKTSQRTASTQHEARRIKMCPYHSEVVDASLAAGEPGAGYNALAQHAWGENHCAGGWEGKCNFKPAMTTQTFWDERKEQAEQRRQEREEQRQLEQEQAEQAQAEEEAPEAVQEPVAEAPEEAPDNVVEFPSEERTEAPEAVSTEPATEVPMAMAASADDRAPLDSGRPSRSPRPTSVHAAIKQGGPPYGHPDSDALRGNLSPFDDPADDPYHTGERVSCPACGGEGTHLGTLGKREHFRCRDCGWTFSDQDQALEDVDTRHLPELDIQRGVGRPLASHEAADPHGKGKIGPIERQDVEREEGPVSEIDKRKWTPEAVKDIDADSADGPHPTKTIDPVKPIQPKDDGKPDQIGEQVTEHQDVTKDTNPIKGDATKTWPAGSQADPVTSAKVDNDINRNPLQALVEDEYDGFPPEAEIQQAISNHRPA